MKNHARFLFIAFFGFASAGHARTFTQVYEPVVESSGEAEFSQWATARTGKDNGRYTAWDFREEVEFALNDRFLTALYLNFGHERSDGVDGRSDHDGWTFQGLSSEWIYVPRAMKDEAIGVGLYGEGTVSDDALEIEERLLIGQRFPRWSWAANIALEQEWERDDGHTEKEGTLELSLGVARKLSRAWTAGLEARHNQLFEDFTDQSARAFFAGPFARYQGDEWFVTASVLPQLQGDGPGSRDGYQTDEFERVEIRVIAGFDL